MLVNYRTNIISNFLKHVLRITIFFFILVIVMNILEEIKFFKNYDDNLFLSVFLTLLNTPSIMFEIFPFIFLIATLFFFIEILDKNELVIYKLNGITNLNIINTLVFTTFLTGVFIILIFYNLSSTLKFFYLDIKNDYSKDDKYLAVVTSNGLWIRDQIDGNINIINAEKISGNNITSVLITQFDLDSQNATIAVGDPNL